jgi:WD40 repeat protein
MRRPGWVTAYFVADGGVLTLSSGNQPKLWDSTGRLKRDLPLTEEQPERQYFFYPSDTILSRDRRLVARSDRNGVALLETSTGQVKHLLGDIGEPLDFSPDGRKLLVLKRGSKVGSPCGQVRCDLQIYDVTSGQLKITFRKISGDNRRYWSPNGAVIITVSGVLLDTRTGRVANLPYQACTPDRIIGSTQCDPFIFNADGHIALKLKNPLKLWSTDTGEPFATIDRAFSPAAFSPTDARVLITRGMDKTTALIWEIQL